MLSATVEIALNQVLTAAQFSVSIVVIGIVVVIIIMSYSRGRCSSYYPIRQEIELRVDWRKRSPLDAVLSFERKEKAAVLSSSE